MPPVAVKTTELPEQKVVGPPALIPALGIGFTVTTVGVELAEVHPLEIDLTV